MVAYPDLSPWPEAERDEAGPLLAVGWLERGHQYRQGAVSEVVIDALVAALVDPWQPYVSPGVHLCSLCRVSSGPRTVDYKGTVVALGQANLFVPGSRCVYVAPSSIIHYIDAHEYAPPDAFCTALLSCPPMRSVAYLRALLQNGARTLIQQR
jgi:hypothetical protein